MHIAGRHTWLHYPVDMSIDILFLQDLIIHHEPKQNTVTMPYQSTRPLHSRLILTVSRLTLKLQSTNSASHVPVSLLANRDSCSRLSFLVQSTNSRTSRLKISYSRLKLSKVELLSVDHLQSTTLLVQSTNSRTSRLIRRLQSTKTVKNRLSTFCIWDQSTTVCLQSTNPAISAVICLQNHTYSRLIPDLVD